MLPKSELDRLRHDMQVTLMDTCSILTATNTPDGFGGQSITWGTVSYSVPCRLDQRSGREQIAGGGFRWYTVNTLTLSADTEIAVSNRVEVGGATYTVTNINEGSGLGVRLVIVERI